jgi:RNA polymerase sigma factor (sigma-70 family)
MMAPDEFTLLEQYASDESQDAYRQLVERYAGLVYAAARRQMRDSHLAEDVTQAVFVVLSRKAGSIRRGQPLSAWLLTTTRYTCINALRVETHRRATESRAAQMRSEVTSQPPTADESSSQEELAQMLDEGMGRLKRADRDAVLLRYFESKSLRDVGAALGISEEAAQKRISRAVDRLRDFFVRRGAKVSAGAVATFLAARATEAAPAGLTSAIAAGQIGEVALNLAKGAIMMTWIHNVTVAGVVAMVLAGTVVAGIFSIKSRNAPPGAPQTQAPVTNMSAPTSAGSPDKWTATFAGGAKVELVGLADFVNRDAAAPRWWSPDGTAIPSPGFDLRDNADLGNMRNTRKIQLLLRFTGINEPDRAPRVLVNEAGMQVSNWEGAWQQHTDLRQVIAAVPNGNTQVSVRVGLPRGEFSDTVLLDLNSGAPPADMPLMIGAINTDADGGSGIEVLRTPLNIDSRKFEQRVVVMTRDGKRVESARGASIARPGGQLIHFACPKDNIDKIVVASRPIEWMLVKNVSTVPTGGKPTDVQITPSTNP